MQDGSNRVAGVGGFIEHAGKRYQLSVPSRGDRAELVAYLVSKRKSPLEATLTLLDKVGPDMRDHVLRVGLEMASRERTATAEEIKEYGETYEGTCHMLWFALRRKNPEFDTLEKVTAFWAEYQDARVAELQAKLDQATGFLTDGVQPENPTATAPTTTAQP